MKDNTNYMSNFRIGVVCQHMGLHRNIMSGGGHHMGMDRFSLGCLLFKLLLYGMMLELWSI